MSEGEDLTRAKALPVLQPAPGWGREGVWLSCRFKQVLLSQDMGARCFYWLLLQFFGGKLPVVQGQFNDKCEENDVQLGVSELGGFGLVTHTQKKIRFYYL